MEETHNLSVARKIIDLAFNQADFSQLEAAFRPGYIEHQFGLHKDVEGMKNDILYLRKAFPDLHLTVEEMIEVGDRVWMRLTARGTNLGGMMGPPNGKTFEIAVFDELRFENGQVVEHWGAPDRFAQLIQLGLLPTHQ